MIPLPSSNHQEEELKAVLELDAIVHSPARFAILTFLLPRGQVIFTTIQKALGLTAGNLSSHIRKLETHGLVTVQKKFVDAKPTTVIFLSEEGRRSVVNYASAMSTILISMLERLKGDDILKYAQDVQQLVEKSEEDS